METSGRPGSRSALAALWSMLRLACTAAACAHVAFLLLFAGLGLPVLVATNVASVALFIGCRALLGRGRHVLAVSLMNAEVVLHACIASRVLGWDSGFHYYLLTLVGPLAVVMNGSLASKAVRLLACAVGYMALDAWTRSATPVDVLAPAVRDAIRYANIAGTLVIIGFMATTYRQIVDSAERALQTLARTDPLTGLHNRRHLLEIAREARAAPHVADAIHLLLCDIDHFKRINDDHGHELGDVVLEQVADAVTRAVRAADSVARWGGEEFIVLLPGADFDRAMQVAERIRAAVAALSLERPTLASPLAVTLTIGVARVDPAEAIDAAIARADAALYRGKAAGRNRVVADA